MGGIGLDQVFDTRGSTLLTPPKTTDVNAVIWYRGVGQIRMECRRPTHLVHDGDQ